MTAIVSSAHFSNSSGESFTLTNGSQTGRVLAVVVSQYIATSFLASATFNGVTSTVDRLNPSQTGSFYTQISYWTDDDLPAVAGTYSLSLDHGSGQIVSIYELSGWDGTAPEFKSDFLVGNAWATPETISFAGDTTDAVILMPVVSGGTSNGVQTVAGQTIDNELDRKLVISKVDSGGDGSITLDAQTFRDYLYDAVAFLSAGGGTTPTITNINGDNEFTPGEANTLNGTNLSTTGGSIVIDGETQTITNRTATAITFTGVRGGNPYNTDLTLTYTDASNNTVTQTVQQVPQSGTFAVTAASPNTTDDASLWTGLVDTSTGDPVTVVDGDQAWVKDPNNLGNLSITPAGAISADTTGTFVVQFRKASEGVWGSDQTVSFTLPTEPSVPNIYLKKKQNKRRRYTANLFGAWSNRFIGEQDE